MRPWERVRPFPPAEKARLAVEIARDYVRILWARDRRELSDLLARLRAPAESGPRPDTDLDTAYSRAWQHANAVRRTLRRMPTDSRCLMQALVLTALLARRGINTTLVIGVRPGEDFEAHAWLELEGRPLLPAAQDVYSELTRV